MSILARLIVLVVLALIPAIVAQVINAEALGRDRRAEIRTIALQAAEIDNAALAGIIGGIRHSLAGLAELAPVRDFDRRGCNSLFSALAQEYPHDVSIGAADIHGAVFCSSAPNLPSAMIADRDYFRGAIETNRFSVGKFAVSRLTGDDVIHFAYPIHGANDKITGAVVAALTLHGLADTLKRSPLRSGMTLIVTDRAGTVLVRLPERTGWVGRTLPKAELAMINRPGAGVVETRDIAGQRAIVGFVPITVPPPNIYVLLSIDEKVAFQAIDKATWRSAALMLLTFALALLIAWLVGVRFIRRPVRHLLAATRRWQDGDYAARANLTDHSSEIGELGQAFDQMAARLQRREQQVAAASRAKNIVLATAGHDLRQPLQIIAMGLSTLARKPLNEAETRHVKRMDAALDRVTAALDTLVEASRLQFGGIEPHYRDFAIATVLEEVRDQWLPRVEAKGLRFRMRSTDAVIRSDPEMLRTILNNLVANAIKYTERGGVLVMCRRRQAKLLIDVTDTGIGIPADQLKVIFTEFQQLNSQYEGFGLGLWIVQGTAELLGHRITVRSRSGCGTRFAIEVPISGASPAST